MKRCSVSRNLTSTQPCKQTQSRVVMSRWTTPKSCGRFGALWLSKMKGNSTRQKTGQKSSNIVAVPCEFINAQKSVTVSVNFFFINKYVFLMTVSKNICFTTTSHCSTRKVQHYWNFLKEVLIMYYRRGLRVTLLRGELESSH